MKQFRQYFPKTDDGNGSTWMWRRVCAASQFTRLPFWEPNFQDIIDSSYCLDNQEVV